MADAARAHKVASFWDQNVGGHCEPFAHWESPASIQHALNKLVTGDIWAHPPGWFMQHYGPFAHVAELGCGDGILAQVLLGGDPALTMDAYDISPRSLARAAERIKTHLGPTDRCRFVQIDLNKESLPEAVYDAVLTTGAMHHVERLDFCFGSIRRSLRPGGYLWLNDYVGPRRFQWSDTQMRLADELLALAPKAWRLRDKVIRCDERKLRDLDPSEAVAPQQIEAGLAAHFEIVQKWPRGGTLLAPIFGSGCLDAAMGDSAEGLAILAAMFEAEQDLIREGALPSESYLYIAKPRPAAADIVREAFERHAGPAPEAAQCGIRGDLEQWLHLNEVAAFESVRARDWVAPFPPRALMHRTSGLDDVRHFGAHGADIVRALATASPRPLTDYRDLLDFGVGVGRVARLFKGFEGRYAGVDVDADNIAWVAECLPWVEAAKTEPGAALPFSDARFDAVVSVSVFTHMNEQNQLFYLEELRRVTQPGAILFLTVSGERVLARAESEPAIAAMLAAPEGGLAAARTAFNAGSGFCFLLQHGHLTSTANEYGVTFISESYVASHWSRYFDVQDIRCGAIHDFQDIVVLRRRDDI
ncbi:methyltransferase domain-containing protein [Methylocapsa polymorpha]|uniref:Methyltransferase domain-containing protein n=1 Tax=Methylocapsa polymorpha TaxID=3080828 RepID=A0ABZ0HXK5_9HYPH|nr:methyltransferase domain-containing protein [Methylocapsa sp. RX1]